MPRAISVRRKYLLALSKEFSAPSSQRCVRGSRKLFGGPPAGVAATEAVAEKGATPQEEKMVLREERGVVRGLGHGRA